MKAKRKYKPAVNGQVKRKGKAPKFAKIAAKPLSEDQIKMFVAHYKAHGTIPGNKVPCNQSGKLTTAVGPWLKKKVKEAGGVEEFLRGYKCRGVLKKVKPFKEPRVTKKMRRQERQEKDEKLEELLQTRVFVNRNAPQQKMSAEGWVNESRSACLAPNIFLDNERNCEGCPWYGICENRLKNLPKFISYKNGEFVYDSKVKK